MREAIERLKRWGGFLPAREEDVQKAIVELDERLAAVEKFKSDMEDDLRKLIEKLESAGMPQTL